MGALTGEHAAENLSLKEKNRIAQQKSRAKRRAQDTEAENTLSDVSKQLELIKGQLTAAQSRNVVLEKVVQLRNNPLGLLASNSSANIPVPAHPETSSSDSGFVPSSLYKTILSAPVNVDAILDTRKRQQGLLQYTASQLKNFGHNDIAMLWKEYVSRLAEGLLQSDGHPDTSAAKQIEDTLDELMQFWCCIPISHSLRQTQFQHPKVEIDGVCDEAPPEGMWCSVAKAMRLDQQQQLQMCSIREYLLSNLDKIMDARQGIGQQLLSAVQGQYDATFQLASSHIHTRNATQKLHQNVQQVQECLRRFEIASKAIASPRQIAVFCVHSYPWLPDTLALVNAVSKLQNGHGQHCSKDVSDTPAADLFKHAGSASACSAMGPCCATPAV